MSAITYLIKRFHFNGNWETIRRGLTLAEAQEHCSREDTHGDGWFDGYDVDVSGEEDDD